MHVKTYLAGNARKLDLRLYEYLFEQAGAQPVLDELAAYQNSDGGFGQSLEPDLRLPASSALATTVALQYLAKIDAPANELTKQALRYLMATYDDKKGRWTNIPPEADNYPRAPWWNYPDARESAEWGNPSAEILGYLLENAEVVNDQPFLDKLTEQALQRLNATTQPEQHEVQCYIRLYKRATADLRAKLHGKLAAHIMQLAKTRPKDWEGYVATPLTFVDSPDSPFAELFDAQVLIDNANFIKSKRVSGDHWEPTWEWGQFTDEWPRAKQDWSGKLTIENLLLLKAFGLGAD